MSTTVTTMADFITLSSENYFAWHMSVLTAYHGSSQIALHMGFSIELLLMPNGSNKMVVMQAKLDRFGSSQVIFQIMQALRLLLLTTDSEHNMRVQLS